MLKEDVIDENNCKALSQIGANIIPNDSHFAIKWKGLTEK